jgi:hypothetical protein
VIDDSLLQNLQAIDGVEAPRSLGRPLFKPLVEVVVPGMFAITAAEASPNALRLVVVDSLCIGAVGLGR